MIPRRPPTLLGTSDQKRHFEKRPIEEKRERISSWKERVSWTRDELLELSRAPELVYKVLESEIANETGGTEGVDSALLNKACCHLGSGTEEEKRGSSGRIRDLRMRPAGERAERNLTEPTGIDPSVAPGTHPSGKTLLWQRRSACLSGTRCHFLTSR
jgi:hypothetical protein